VKKISQNKYILFAIIIIAVIGVTSLPLSGLLDYKGGHQYIELYLLGPNKMTTDYPSTVVPGRVYSLFIGVGNHYATPVDVLVKVKLLSSYNLNPDRVQGTPSEEDPLYEYHFSVLVEETVEKSLSFSIIDAITRENQVIINSININDNDYTINESTFWNSPESVVHYRLLMELWVSNSTTGDFEYTHRFVNLQLNLQL
jgi:uncharacterized membrane protein